MNSESDNRRVTKKYRCEKCSSFFKKLVEVHEDFVQCTSCDWMAEEISDKEYSELKKRKENQSNTTNNSQGRSSSNVNSNQGRSGVFSNSNVNYNVNINNNGQPFSYSFNSGNNGNNGNIGNDFFGNMNQFSSNMNNFSNQMNMMSNNMNNMNQDFNQNQIYSSFFDQNNRNSPFSVFNNSFFNGFIRNPVRGNVTRININNSLFEPEFFSFGSNNNDVFQDNYSANFNSNFNDRSFFNSYLSEILMNMQNRRDREGEVGTSKSAYEKLKKFEMNETYCNKGKDGKIEKPNCIICIADIEMKAKTLLIPCGHMFHESCIKEWLEKHNTCPVCRFELPAN